MKAENTVEVVKKHLLNQKQHVNRMQDRRLTKLAYLYNYKGQRDMEDPDLNKKISFKI